MTNEWVIELDRWLGMIKVFLAVKFENDKYWIVKTLGMDGVE